MTGKTQYDAAHFSFLEMIRAFNDLAGPVAAKIALLRIATQATSEVPEQTFATIEDFVMSAGEMGNPISQFEGQAHYYGEGIFGLPKCPFAPSIANYKRIKGALPEEYTEITDSLNKPSAGAESLRIGEGAAVSPFCGVHQPIRSALGQRIKIGGTPLKIYQLGCKSDAGHKGLAERWIEEANVDRGLVDRILNDNMCCYCFRTEA